MGRRRLRIGPRALRACHTCPTHDGISFSTTSTLTTAWCGVVLHPPDVEWSRKQTETFQPGCAHGRERETWDGGGRGRRRGEEGGDLKPPLPSPLVPDVLRIEVLAIVEEVLRERRLLLDDAEGGEPAAGARNDLEHDAAEEVAADRHRHHHAEEAHLEAMMRRRVAQAGPSPRPLAAKVARRGDYGVGRGGWPRYLQRR